MKSAILIAASAMVLCACASSVISDINDSAVKVQASFSDNSRGDVTAEANKGCQIYNKKAVPISYRCLDDFCIRKEFLFACKADPNFVAAGGELQQSTLTGTLDAAPTNDGKWAGEGGNDGCGAAWAAEIVVQTGKAHGTLWRGKIRYDILGSVDAQGHMEKALATKSAASNGLVGPRFLALEMTFQGEGADGGYVAPNLNTSNCTASISLTHYPS